jgi:uncharacterized protein DUF3237
MATMIRPAISIELVRLGHLSVALEPPLVLENTPSGTRYIVGVRSARFEGERLMASLKGVAAADWLTISPDGGIATLDVRATFETDDEALIFSHCNGRIDLSKGRGKSPVYAAPLYDTGDPRYRWLNNIQAVAKGVLTEDLSQLDYEVFELR